MSIFDVKDRIPINVLSNKAVRYGVYDEYGKLLRYEYMKREDEPIEEGDKINRVFFDDFQTKAIGYNVIDSYEDVEKRTGTGGTSVFSKSFDTAEIDWVSSSVFGNGNVLIAYSDSGNEKYGTYCIFSETGEVMLSPTTFNSVETQYIKTATLKDGRIIICYYDVTNTNGCFIIVGEDGGIELTEVIFYSSYTYETSPVVLENGNIFIAYAQSNQGTYAIYSIDGTKISGGYFNSGAQSYENSACLLKNGNVFIAFKDGGNSGYGSFVIKDPTGDTIKSKTVFHKWITEYTSCCTMNNGNVLVAFQDASDSKHGKFVIIDQEGNIIQESTQFRGTTVQATSTAALADGRAIITYQRYSSTSSAPGEFVVINEDGTICQDFSGGYGVFSSGQISSSSVNLLKNGNAAIAYSDDYANNGGFRAVDFGEKYYIRNFKVEGTGKPLVNQKMNVYKTASAEQIPYKTIASTSTSFKSTIELQNGNIFIAYYSSTKGYYCIVNRENEIVKNSILLFASEAIYYLNAFQLTDGNIWIIYRNGTYEIKSVIVNQELEIVKEVKINIPLDVYEFGCTLMSNDNLFVLYGAPSNTYYGIYNQDGNAVITDVEIAAQRHAYFSAVLLENGNVFASFSQSTNISGTYYRIGYTCVVSSTGEMVKEPAVVQENHTMLYTKAKPTPEGGAIIAYVGQNYTGKFGLLKYVTFDPDGNKIHEPITITGNNPSTSFGFTTTKNNEIIFVYKRADSTSGILVLDREGNVLKESTPFNLSSPSYPDALELKDGNIAIITSGGVWLYIFQDIYKVPNIKNNIEEYAINGIPIAGNVLSSVTYYKFMYNGTVWVFDSSNVIKGSYTLPGSATTKTIDFPQAKYVILDAENSDYGARMLKPGESGLTLYLGSNTSNYVKVGLSSAGTTLTISSSVSSSLKISYVVVM